MKIINVGMDYSIYDDSLKVFDALPPKTYAINFSPMAGFSMSERPDLDINEKVYGVHEEKAQKVLHSFLGFERNLGVILSGNKGIGKSMFARILCKKAISKGIPVIVVDRFIPGIARYIESVEQEVLVLFDEFDKTFASIKTGENEADPQAGLLGLFDGVSSGKKLFVITCNNLNKLNDFLVNRPGRFHYHFRFDYPSEDQIREYLKDKLDPMYYGEIENVIFFAKRVCLNFDCLRAIAFELNNGESFKRAIEDLNIINVEETRYNVTLRFEDGTELIHKRFGMNLSAESGRYEIEMFDHANRNVLDIRFCTDDVQYNMQIGKLIVPTERTEITWWSDEKKEQMKDKKIAYLSFAICGEPSLRYAFLS